MSLSDGPQTRARVSELVRQPSPGARALRIERFHRPTMKQRAGEVFSSLVFSNDDTSDHAATTPGRKVSWRDGAGAELRAIEVHPAAPDFEDGVLPLCFGVIRGHDVWLDLWCDTETLLDGRRSVERWNGMDLLGLGASSAAPYRERSALWDAVAEELGSLGCSVERHADAVVVQRERVRPPQTWSLLFLPLLVWLVPLALVSRRFRHAARMFFVNALRGQRSRVVYRVNPSWLRAERAASGSPMVQVEVACRDILTASLAPVGTKVGPLTPYALRVVTHDRVVAFPTLELETAEQSRALGAALHRLALTSAASR